MRSFAQPLARADHVGWNRFEEWRRELREFGTVLERKGITATKAARTIDELCEFYKERYALPVRYDGEKRVVPIVISSSRRPGREASR